MTYIEAEEPPSMFDELMSRGERLRQLRLLAQADEEERQRNKQQSKQKKVKQCSGPTTKLKTLHDVHLQKKHTENERIVITNESMEIVHENTKTKEKNYQYNNFVSSLPLCSSSNHLTYSTIYSSSTNSLVGDETMLVPQSQEDENELFIQQSGEYDNEEEEGVDKIDILPDSKLKILRYDSYLSHQRYNDDYKHSDCHFIDFGYVGDDILTSGNKSLMNAGFCVNQMPNRLIIEQQKSLGKGGLVWDAGVILADHLIATQDEWTRHYNDIITPCDSLSVASISASKHFTKMVELGAGTGVTGLMIAKAVSNIQMVITDLPDVMRLMERNVERNFCIDSIGHSPESTITDQELVIMDRGDAAQEIPRLKELSGVSSQLSNADLCSMYDVCNDDYVIDSFKQSNNYVSAKVLRWGMKEDYVDGPFDVVIAGDVVTSLYDPTALAQTIYDLCHEKSIVFICYKRRLDKFHDVFDDVMRLLFETVDILPPVTRHKNINNVCIMRASERRPNIALK